MPIEDLSAEWLEVQPGPGSLNGARRIIVPSVYPDATGVCFERNGVFDRCDATGRNEGSEFHFYTSPTGPVDLAIGDVLVATWTGVDGVDYTASYVVPDPETPITDPPPPVETSVEWLEMQPGPGSLNGARRIIVVTPYPDFAGVCFHHNGVFNRCDNTGRAEGSEFHTYPPVNLVAGDVVTASWVDQDGGDHVATYEVPAVPPVTDPPGSTDPYSLSFDTEGDFDLLKFELADGRPWNDPGVDFFGDHAVPANPGDPCGAPGSQRTLSTKQWSRTTPVTRINDAQVRAAGIAYWCANGGGHMMTAMNSHGYFHLDFTPINPDGSVKVFSDVSQVRWDQNTTDLIGSWTEMTIVPLSVFNANGGRLDYTNNKFRSGPGSWGLNLSGGVLKQVHTGQNIETHTASSLTDDKFVNPNTSTDVGSRFPQEIQRTDLIPSGPVVIIGSHVGYNPDKRTNTVRRYTWHWKNLTIS